MFQPDQSSPSNSVDSHPHPHQPGDGPFNGPDWYGQYTNRSADEAPPPPGSRSLTPLIPLSRSPSPNEGNSRPAILRRVFPQPYSPVSILIRISGREAANFAQELALYISLRYQDLDNHLPVPMARGEAAWGDIPISDAVEDNSMEVDAGDGIMTLLSS